MVGLGYVGLPLVVEFAHAGFCVTGIDVQQSKVDAINRGESYIQDIPTSALEPLVKAGKVRATTDFSVVKDLDTINICVPTPLRKTKDPDMSFIVNACQEIAKHFHPGTLVILESTTYPGTTDELMLPDVRGSRAQGWQRLLHVFFAGARGSRQSQISDQEHSQSGGRHHAGLHRNRRAVLQAGAGYRGPGGLHPRRGNGEAARKHVPHDQHRPGRTKSR